MRLAVRFMSIAIAVLAGLETGCGDDMAPLPSPAVWSKHAGNPVLSHGPPGSWDEIEVGTPCVRAEGGYTMWYTGWGANVSQIGVATSFDGVTWTKLLENPVLGPGADGSWDDRGVRDPCVVPGDGTGWRMYYTGVGAAGRRIGLATSDDGLHWIRSDANPVLIPSVTQPAWDDREVFTPWAAQDNLDYKLWFGALGFQSLSIGLATSDDGVGWTKLTTPVLNGMVLEAPNFAPCVLGRGDSFRIWYLARHEFAGGFRPAGIDYAQSHDGIDWTAHRTVLSPGDPGAWDDAALRAVCVLDQGGEMRMWYEGRGLHAAGDSTVTLSAIGLATQ